MVLNFFWPVGFIITDNRIHLRFTLRVTIEPIGLLDWFTMQTFNSVLLHGYAHHVTKSWVYFSS